MRAEIERIELQGLGEKRDDTVVRTGLRELRGALTQGGEGTGAVRLLHADLRDTAVATGQRREFRAEIRELLLGLAQPTGLQLAQA